MPHNLKIASIGQPEYKAPLYETDLDDLYEIRRFPIVLDPTQGDLATVTGMADVINFAPDIAVFFRPTSSATTCFPVLLGRRSEISPNLIRNTFLAPSTTQAIPSSDSSC